MEFNVSANKLLLPSLKWQPINVERLGLVNKGKEVEKVRTPVVKNFFWDIILWYLLRFSLTVDNFGIIFEVMVSEILGDL